MFRVSKQALEELATNLWQTNTLEILRVVELCENRLQRTRADTHETGLYKKGEACKIQK